MSLQARIQSLASLFGLEATPRSEGRVAMSDNSPSSGETCPELVQEVVDNIPGLKVTLGGTVYRP